MKDERSSWCKVVFCVLLFQSVMFINDLTVRGYFPAPSEESMELETVLMETSI